MICTEEKKPFIITLSLYNVAHKIITKYTDVIDCDVKKIESSIMCQDIFVLSYQENNSQTTHFQPKQAAHLPV